MEETKKSENDIILDEIAKDFAQIDITNLALEAARHPHLKSKYMRLYNDQKKKLIAIEQYKRGLRAVLIRYYGQKNPRPTQEELDFYKLTDLDGLVSSLLIPDLKEYIETHPVYQKIETRYEEKKTIVALLEHAYQKGTNEKYWSIKTALDSQMYINGK